MTWVVCRFQCVCVCVYVNLHSVCASVRLRGYACCFCLFVFFLDCLAKPRLSSRHPEAHVIDYEPEPNPAPPVRSWPPAQLWPPVDCPAHPFILCQQLRAAMCLRISSSRHHSQKTWAERDRQRERMHVTISLTGQSAGQTKSAPRSTPTWPLSLRRVCCIHSKATIGCPTRRAIH